MRGVVMVAAVAVVMAAVECKRSNGAYCDDTRPCPSGLACDLVARECHVASTGGADLAGVVDMAGCSCGGTTPICVAMTCVSCLSTSDPDGACSAASPMTPFCMTTGNDAGACVACRDASDCSNPTPFCDSLTLSCRGCLADSECPSLVCDLTPGSANHGLCVPTSQVEYADGSAPMGGNGLTPTTARQKIQDAINHAVGADKRPYVHIAAGTYNENVGVSNATIYLVGADGVLIKPTNMDALGSQNAGSLTIRNITATAPSGNAANCQNATFVAYRSQLIGSSQNGIFANTCGLVVDGCWIDSDVQGGIYIQGGNFQVINSIITRNGGAGGFYQLATATTTIFVANTVADNSASGTVAGVTCASSSSFVVRNSILYNDKGTTGTITSETNCASSFCASDDATAGPMSTVNLVATPPGFKGGAPVSAASYHLTSTSPCLDKATPQYAPDHDFDFRPRPDAKTMLPDIGACELQQ
jgi:hypothetical protein